MPTFPLISMFPSFLSICKRILGSIGLTNYCQVFPFLKETPESIGLKLNGNIGAKKSNSKNTSH